MTVDIRDQVSAALAGFRQSMEPSHINPIIGAALVILFQNWFLAMPQNKLGWPSTGFYPDAARSTNYRVLADDVWISINKLGLRERYEGGDITPVQGKYLTIPARAEAYGKRAREFDDLVVAFRRIGGVVKAWALVEAAHHESTIGKRKKDGSRNVTPEEEYGGAVMFWLVEHVTQQPDPNVLPPDQVITATAIEAIEDRVALMNRRGGLN